MADLRTPPRGRRSRRFMSFVLLLVAALLVAGTADARKKKKDPNKGKFTVSQSMAKKLTPALEALQAEEYVEAERLLKALEARADRYKPYERALIFQMLGYLESGQDRFREALVYFEKCLAQEAMPPVTQTQTRYNVGQLYMATEQYAKAVESLNLWFKVAENPASSAYYLLAVAHYQNRDIEKAIIPAETAVRIAKNVRESWLQLLVGLYYETKQYPKAKEPLEALLMLNPKKAYWTQLSSLYAHLGEEEKSLAVMQLAYSQGFLDKDRELRQLAQLYLYHAIPYRAAGVLEKGFADELVEEHTDAYAMLANSWLLAREYDLALGPLERAAEMSSKGTLFVQLGQVLLDRESWDAAGDALSAGLEKGDLSDRGSANLMLGIAHYHQSHMASARKYFVAARDGERSRESAVKWLQLLDREAQAG